MARAQRHKTAKTIGLKFIISPSKNFFLGPGGAVVLHLAFFSRVFSGYWLFSLKKCVGQCEQSVAEMAKCRGHAFTLPDAAKVIISVLFAFMLVISNVGFFVPIKFLGSECVHAYKSPSCIARGAKLNAVLDIVRIDLQPDRELHAEKFIVGLILRVCLIVGLTVWN
jgi:hypothetical protein